MEFVQAQPYVWWESSDGYLISPGELRGRNRMFISTDEGLLEIRCPEEEPVFHPERGDRTLPLPQV